MYCLYCHTNKVNGKKYFGITGMDPRRRWMNGIGYKSSRHFNFAIEKYGWDSFEHEIIADGLTKEEACQMEQEYIARFKTTDDRYGYNMSEGGQGGRLGTTQSEETRKLISQANVGRVFSQETRQKLSEAAKGRTFSGETRAKISAAKKGKKLTPEHARKIGNASRGRKLSQEAKDKIRESRRGVMKPVYCVETDTTYESTSEAARQLGLERTNLKATLQGKHKHCGGYHFKYAD